MKHDVTVDVPLCVDLDGTLVRTDLLHESVFGLFKHSFTDLFLLPFWLLKGKAYLKSQIAKRVKIDVAKLPYNKDFLSYLNEVHASGRKLVLATASHISIAQAIADHLKVFEKVVATTDTRNCSGAAKARDLVDAFGDKGFDYAGNDFIDKKVWAHSRRAIVVNPGKGLIRTLGDEITIDKVFDDRRNQFAEYLRAVRPHQWLKNLLIFIPLLLSHQILEKTLLLNSLIAFVAFGLCASSVYLLNDLLDLENDRHHATKKDRPFASGNIPVLGGVVLIPLLLLLSAILAYFLSYQFQLVLILYYSITVSYSIRLKEPPLIDVLVLAGLYTIRIIAGAAAILIEPSFWLLSFSMFLFLSLAILKRYTELAEMTDLGPAKGRGYRIADVETLSQFGTASAYVAVLVLALYINDQTTTNIYTYPKVLWVLCPMTLFLISRAWLLARRGMMHEDPVVFLMRDRKSQAFIGLGAAAVFLAA